VTLHPLLPVDHVGEAPPSVVRPPHDVGSPGVVHLIDSDDDCKKRQLRAARVQAEDARTPYRSLRVGNTSIRGRVLYCFRELANGDFFIVD
jgi:hypothetical protein